jgi:recombination protein RecT
MQRVPGDKLAPFREALAAQEEAFRRALPSTVAKFLTPERITKMTLAAISRSPQLLLCTRESILRSVMDAVSLGLEPAGPLGHAYLVPFNKNVKDERGNWQKIKEAQLIIGYRGFIALARRSGEIQSVNANVIYSRDRYRVNLAESTVEHEPYMPEMPTAEEAEAKEIDAVDLMHRGAPVAVYSVAQFVGGGRHVDFMTIGDVERIRSRSKSGDDGPWQTDYDEMARKTVIRRAAKYWPLSTELASALEIDSQDDVVVSNGVRPAVVHELPAPSVVAGTTNAAPVSGDSDAHDDSADEAPPADAPAGEPGKYDYGPPAMTDAEVASSQPATKRVLGRVRGAAKPAPREPGQEG